MVELVVKFIKRINWEYVIVALGLILLGYVIGIIGFGADVRLGDLGGIIGGVSSAVLTYIAYKGLDAYKHQDRYTKAKLAAENIININFPWLTEKLNSEFESICIEAFDLENILYRGFGADHAHETLLLIKSRLDSIDDLVKKFSKIKVLNLKLKHEKNDLYEEIKILIELVEKFRAEVFNLFYSVRYMNDEVDSPLNKKIIDKIIEGVSGCDGINIIDVLAEKIGINYPFPYKGSGKDREIIMELEDMVAGDYRY